MSWMPLIDQNKRLGRLQRYHRSLGRSTSGRTNGATGIGENRISGRSRGRADIEPVVSTDRPRRMTVASTRWRFGRMCWRADAIDRACRAEPAVRSGPCRTLALACRRCSTRSAAAAEPLSTLDGFVRWRASACRGCAVSWASRERRRHHFRTRFTAVRATSTWSPR